MAYRVTVSEDYEQVALPNGVILNGGESATLSSKYFFLIPEVNHDVLFSSVEEVGSGGGGGGMRPEDISAEAPLVWDAEASTLTINISSTDISDATAVGQGVITASSAEEARTLLEAAAEDHTHAVGDLSDITATGVSVATAADAAGARGAIGAGTGSSDLELGTTATTAAAGNHSHPEYLEATPGAAVADATDDAVVTVNELLVSLRASGLLSET